MVTCKQLMSRKIIHNKMPDNINSDEPKASMSNKIKKINKECDFKDSQKALQYFDSKTNAFSAIHTFGVNYNSEMLNLTTSKDDCMILCGASHFAILYDYKNKLMKTLTGNRNDVTALATDYNGRYIVTASKGADVCVIIWERSTREPICTLFDSHPIYGVAKVGISGNSKYLVTVGNEPKPIVKFWLWTTGNETENDVYEIKSSRSGTVQDVSFCPLQQEDFMVTFENLVVFMTWREESLHVSSPKVRARKNFGLYKSSTYVESSYQCVTATDTGWVLIWGNTYCDEPFSPTNLNNRKIFIKAIKIQNSAINKIVAVDNLIVTGDVDGHIKFYDKKMKILYWCQNFKLESIVSIGFHLFRRKYVFDDLTNFKDDVIEPAEEVCEDCSSENEHFYAQLVPSDATLERLPFTVRDFITLTSDGRVGYIHFMENRYELLNQKSESPITVIEAHDEKPVLVLAYASGRLCSYDFQEFKFLFESSDFILKTSEDEEVYITCLKYARHGRFLACGTSNGYLYFLHTITLEVAKKPFRTIKQKIEKICFSPDNKYLTYYDDTMQVVLFKFDQESLEFRYYSRNIAHYKSIVDICLVQHDDRTRLFTVGRDRLLVEYNTGYSEFGCLEVLHKHTIEQAAVPRSMVHRDDSADRYFLVANDQYKFQTVVEQDGSVFCRRTTLGPALDQPVKQMAVTRGGKHLLYVTEQFLGLHMYPPDGNPYKHISFTGHPREILQFVMSDDEQFIFTIGRDDNCCLMWKIHYESVNIMKERGGKNLEPFGLLIEGGLSGWLFKEMEDLFYYMQILQQGINSQQTRQVTNKIPISSLPTLMRAIGFFPSEYEMENLLREVRLDASAASPGTDEITFEQFFKLYINHKPVFGTSLSVLKKSFLNFTKRGSVKKEQFLEMLCSKGEPFKSEDLMTCLSILINYQDPDDENTVCVEAADKLPQNITFETLIDMLGIDMSKIIPEGILALEN